MSPRDYYAPSERRDYGLIATLAAADGGLETITVPGMTQREAASVVARICDQYGFRVRCLSHPLTIEHDLAGRAPADSIGRPILAPESVTMGAAGRIDLVEREPPSRGGAANRREHECL